MKVTAPAPSSAAPRSLHEVCEAVRMHAARPKAIRELTLDDIDLPSRRITIAGRGAASPRQRGLGGCGWWGRTQPSRSVLRKTPTG